MAEGILTTLSATGSSPRVSAAVTGEADLVPETIFGGVPGVITPPVFVQLPDQPSGKTQAAWGEIVDRIWVIPTFLRPTNPQLLTNIPFVIWQSHSVANSLSSITGSGQTGLTLDITSPVAFAAYESKTVNIQITSTAPPEISAIFNFHFDT